ncbi:MAG TPA: GMC family oxidoreductase, partial [Flavihumibacter sp.]|nr:GMC family oxidoreductase [Flavihumibacter sp.]
RLPTILPSVENQYLGLYFQSEHLPNYNSTVSLSETEKDALGLPLPIVKVAFCDADYRTILEAHRMFMQRYRDSQAGGMLYDESVLMDYIKKRTTKFNSAAHHLGTTRMATSPDKGVVDGNCKVFGMDNLYVAGSSVFTTGSHVNPTLTLVALAIRLGDHLCQL